MIKNWLDRITYTIVGIALLFLLLSACLIALRPSQISPKKAVEEKFTLPLRSFVQKQEKYDTIGEQVFNLKSAPISLQLPDLKQQLFYYGKNNRPDAKNEEVLLNFGFSNNQSIATIAPNDCLYILFDKDQKPPKFTFSVNNQPTTLWIKATPKGTEASINLYMKTDSGQMIQTPQKNAHFMLKERNQAGSGKAWEIGKFKVDATLLSRQKARWYGQDQFLEKHGGDEYQDTIGKERIDFLDEENPYSVFVKEGDFLIWNNGRWNDVKPEDNTSSYPLLVAKKINERVMNLELWNVKGKGKTNLNLLKSAEMKIPTTISQNFKFVGAKTRSQFIFEINKERITLKPKDWLLLTKKGWIKLTTPEEIDDYVNRKITGPLFVFDGLTKIGDSQMISGTVFNTARTEMQPVQLPIQQSRAITPNSTDPEEEKTDSDSDFDEQEMRDIKQRKETNIYPQEDRNGINRNRKPL